MKPPSGEQYYLTAGQLSAVVTEAGATLRRLDFGQRPLIWGFSDTEMCSAGRGQVLAPWPNRLEDGTYSFQGVTGRAAIDDPLTACAIHGLVRWLPWNLEARTQSSVSLSCRLTPQPAYPFHLHLAVEYLLSGNGITLTATITNDGDRPAPVGLGFHPYLAPDIGLDAITLRIPAERYLLLSERLLPLGSAPIDDLEFGALRGADLEVSVDGRSLCHCFTGLRAENGRWTVWLDRGSEHGLEVEVWGDTAFKYVFIFTGESLAPHLRRKGVAIEPMTCPPNALRTGEDLIVLEPDATFQASWGIAVRAT